MNERTNERTMPLCSFPGCVAVSTSAARLCAVHAAGFRRGDGGELVCANCRGAIRKDEWYQVRDGVNWHAAKACRMHPEVAKALAAEATT